MAASRKIAIVFTCAVIVVAALLPGSAAARVVHGDDTRGDAPAAVDVKRFTYANGINRVVIRAFIFEPRPRRSTFYAFYDPGHRAGKELYYTVTSSKRGGGFKTTLYKLHVRVSQTVVECPRMDVRWKRGQASGVRVSIPRSCLGTTAGPAWFRGNVLRNQPYAEDALPRRHVARG